MAKIVSIYSIDELIALGWDVSYAHNETFSTTVSKNFPDFENSGVLIPYTYTQEGATQMEADWGAQMWATAIEAQIQVESLGYRTDLPFLLSELDLYFNKEELRLIKRRVGDDAVEKAYSDAVPELVRMIGNHYDIEAILSDKTTLDPLKIDSRKEVARILKWLTIKNLYGQYEVVPPTVMHNIKMAYKDILTLKMSSGWCHTDYVISRIEDAPTDGFGSLSRSNANVFSENSY